MNVFICLFFSLIIQSLGLANNYPFQEDKISCGYLMSSLEFGSEYDRDLVLSTKEIAEFILELEKNGASPSNSDVLDFQSTYAQNLNSVEIFINRMIENKLDQFHPFNSHSLKLLARDFWVGINSYKQLQEKSGMKALKEVETKLVYLHKDLTNANQILVSGTKTSCN